MNFLSSFLHPERGYQKAQQKLDEGYGQSLQFLMPFLQQGQSAFPQLSNALQSLLNPEALENKWIQGYQESPAAKNLETMAQNQGLDAASAMGLLGSSPALAAIQAGTTQIGQQARQDYLNDLMQKYKEGIGLGQNLYSTGANTAAQLGQSAMTQGQNSAQLAFGAQNAPGSTLGSLLGLVAGGIGAPIGSALAQRWNLAGG